MASVPRGRGTGRPALVAAPYWEERRYTGDSPADRLNGMYQSYQELTTGILVRPLGRHLAGDAPLASHDRVPKRQRLHQVPHPTTPEAWAPASGGTNPDGPAPTAELLRSKDAEVWRLRQRGAAQPDHHQLAVAGLVLDGMLGPLR